MLVYRPEKDLWEGSYTLLDMQGEICTVLLPPPSEPSKFCCTVVKLIIPVELPASIKEAKRRYNHNTPAVVTITIHSDDDLERSIPSHDSCLKDSTENCIYFPKISFPGETIPMKSHEILLSSSTVQSTDDLKYEASGQKEIIGLFKRDVILISA